MRCKPLIKITFIFKQTFFGEQNLQLRGKIKNVTNHDGRDRWGVGVDIEIFDVDDGGGVVGKRFSVRDVER
jgi:hypothetical protein